ncbi:UNVERIFIED_CONTAM: J domain-containing protein required for chloroplast accumulation response 1 [Sesamum radiatum]|uniref:J domain-containing protein required for chloroplast accumulation response 1 n=1 Tax=Sesamum radiatum TaxID=300843 RepID=A0AAW2K2L9_SESRA
MQLLDEKIRLWSTGKEADIRLLLSSLHHILWPNSGWLTIPLMNIIDSSQVKLAYQKAQLCLHPDKLQERGATLPEKYIAEKVFSALQVLDLSSWAINTIYIIGIGMQSIMRLVMGAISGGEPDEDELPHFWSKRGLPLQTPNNEPTKPAEAGGIGHFKVPSVYCNGYK